MEVIILAGGFGTRLQSIVPDLPKCMAHVAGKPFLEHILIYLESQVVDHVVLSLGYKHETVIDWLRSKAFTFKVSWVIEKTPLGTGGAIKYALQKCKQQQVFVLNGDSYFNIELSTMLQNVGADTQAVIALKKMQDFDRYGTVILDTNNTVTQFVEKMPKESGLINTGIYLLLRHNIRWDLYPESFSFEKDFLEKAGNHQVLKGNIQEGLFIDIGIPEDFEKAQSLF